MEILKIILAVFGIVGLTLLIWKPPKLQVKKANRITKTKILEAENEFPMTKNQLKFEYDGGIVSRSKLEEAIDFFISIEPQPGIENGREEYESNLVRYKKEIELANSAIRNYAKQISPLTIEKMQDEFYSFTNSEKYLQSMIHCSVASSVLSTNWNRVGPWLN